MTKEEEIKEKYISLFNGKDEWYSEKLLKRLIINDSCKSKCTNAYPTSLWFRWCSDCNRGFEVCYSNEFNGF